MAGNNDTAAPADAIDIVGGWLEQAHAGPAHQDKLAAVAVDGAVAGAQTAVLKNTVYENASPAVDMGVGTAGLLLAAVAVSLGKKIMHHFKPARTANDKAKQKMERMQAAVRGMSPDVRASSHKKRRARIKRALAIHAVASAIRGRARDIIVGAGASVGALNAAGTASAAGAALTSVGAVGLGTAVGGAAAFLATPVGVGLAGAALFTAGTLALHKVVRQVSGENGIFQPFTDNLIAMALGKRTLRTAASDIKQRYKKMAIHIRDYNLEKKAPAPNSVPVVPTAASPRRQRAERRHAANQSQSTKVRPAKATRQHTRRRALVFS